MNIREDKSNLEIIQDIQNNVKKYLIDNNIKSLIIGVSGGFDSGFNAAILRPICDEIGIPLIGAFIQIESNKQEEVQRATAIGQAFCHEYHISDLTQDYHSLNRTLNVTESSLIDKPLNIKIKHGNIKARLRMIYLYNLAATHNGIVIDNDNKTEWQLGFRTLHGDEGDITPLANFYKTELYQLAKSYLETLSNEREQKALQAVINAVPTDGLGISSSDVEQFGVNSYDEVDLTLMAIERLELGYEEPCPFIDEGQKKIWNRWKNSAFKRQHPYRIFL